MNSFEFNKIIGAILGTVFVVFSLSLISDSLFATHVPEKAGYEIAALETEAGAGGEDAGPAAPEPVGPLLASADVGAGEALFKRCAACHTPEKGGANKIGPNLWGVVDRAKAADRTYAYSAVLKSKGGTWSYRELAGFLHDPRRFAPGTKMAYRGIANSNRMADLLAYLGTLADKRAPLSTTDPHQR